MMQHSLRHSRTALHPRGWELKAHDFDCAAELLVEAVGNREQRLKNDQPEPGQLGWMWFCDVFLNGMVSLPTM